MLSHVEKRCCERQHTSRNTPFVESSAMEIMLLLWDELDDWTHACRHLASTAISEVADLAAPLATALLAGTAALWGALRQFGA
jgi:hypothetical protein